MCYTQNGDFGGVVCIFLLGKKLRQNVTHTLEGLFPTTRARESIYKGVLYRPPWIDPSIHGSTDHGSIHASVMCK